jgi:ferrous iron transport protein B
MSLSYNRICLVGNPNTGKSSLFNQLTGLQQHIGNFPGVTVEKKVGVCTLKNGQQIELIDLPGTYSLIPQSEDERVVYELLAKESHPERPQQIICVIDVSNLERNLLLFTQLYDQNWPLTVALTMTDYLNQNDLQSIQAKLEASFPDVRFVAVNPRIGDGIDLLKETLITTPALLDRNKFGEMAIKDLVNNNVLQRRDAQSRYRRIALLLGDWNPKGSASQKKATISNWDRFLVHPIYGYLLLLALLLVIFQVVFQVASYPMDWIDGAFGELAQIVKNQLPQGPFTDLITDGIIPGIGGVMVFIPQITLLFFFLAMLEESGYMARIVFMTDRLLRPFGLSGRSVIPLISSAACAIPGVMAARSIPNYKDKLITIFVAPLMSCSARIPVYTVLIALVIPSIHWGPFNVQGLVLFALYGLGLITALMAALVMKFVIRAKDPNFLLMEMPMYRWPRWSQVSISIWNKVKVFVLDAGKVILAISILLWGLASYGPSQRMENALREIHTHDHEWSESELEKAEANARLENSYIGIMGKTIEPAIAPLGYDWKIGIALITSFAAREVFVGSMATIYSVNSDGEGDSGLLDKMRAETTETGEPRYNLATGLSLMVFYAYAMQCMATLAVVRRETNSWKWPILQLLAMGALAYLGAWFTYTIFQ